MSDPLDNAKRRPPPITVPPLQYTPAINASQPKNVKHSQQQEEQQKVARNASSSTQQDPRPASSELTSSPDHDGARLPNSSSQRSRASAITTLTSMMEQARASPRKSETGSTVIKSTTRSKHSVRSHHSANSAQAQLEALGNDERTSRAKIEARTEQNFFKMTGQIPPTPIANAARENEIIIVRQDLRKQCRAVSEDRNIERQESAKSPKKKLFGMNLPTFGRSSTPAPPMPSKAAQVFGQAPRNPTIAVVRPIKPAGPFKTPTKTSRSDTTKSLPAKILNEGTHTRSHHSGAARRNRAASRRSPSRGGRQSSDTENTPPMPSAKHSFESGRPPIPPAKDTPPESRATVKPTSPLRRTAPSQRLHESYAANSDAPAPSRFSAFSLFPSPSKLQSTEEAGDTLTKYIPCTADEYQKLIAGEPLSWGSTTAEDDSSREQSAIHETAVDGKLEEEQPTCSNRQSEDQSRGAYTERKDSRDAFRDFMPLASPRFPPPDRTSVEYPYAYNDGTTRQYSPLQPRFYSPSNRSVQMFAEGETPSKNSDTSRLLYTVSTRSDLLRPLEGSNNGSINMLYQGDVNDIDPQSSTGRLVNTNNQDTMLVNAHDNSGLAARVMQELRIGEQLEQTPRQNGGNGHLLPDQSSSRLTDMLHGVSPVRGDFGGKFQPNCPSAVPSPLHKMTDPVTPLQAMPPRLDSSGLFGLALTPKTIHDHFYMTNEHLDVLGKSNWDQIEELKKEMHEKSSNRHAKLVTTVEKHVHEIKMQVDSVNEKADRTTEQSHNIHTKLEKLFEVVKGDVMGALAVQEKKMADMEQSVRDIHMTLQNMQRMLEQKHNEASVGQAHAITSPHTTLGGTSPPGPPGHQLQPSLAGYYGNMTESGREGQPLMPHMQDHRSSSMAQDAQSDARAGYGSSLEQRWGPRASFQGRSSKEERPYPGTNPYQFANSVANGAGQFSNGYSGGYSAYGQQGESHYAFHPGAAK